MYRGFNLLLENNCFEQDLFECLQEVGFESFSAQRAKIVEKISSFADGDGYLDGTKMQENWFPQLRLIFLYHTHTKMRFLLLLLQDG